MRWGEAKSEGGGKQSLTHRLVTIHQKTSELRLPHLRPKKAPSFCSRSFLFYFNGNSRIVMTLSLLTAQKSWVTIVNGPICHRIFFAFDFQVKDYGEWTGGENKSVAKFSCQRLLQSRYISFAIRTCIIRERDKGQNSWKILWAFTLGDFMEGNRSH